MPHYLTPDEQTPAIRGHTRLQSQSSRQGPRQVCTHWFKPRLGQGLDYALSYPDVCLGLILRGIFLNTAAEMEAIYCRSAFAGNARRLAEFDTFFELAAKEVERRGEPPLSPDDAVRFVRVYEDLIISGDRDAIWRFYVFENNIIEEDPSALKDPRTIDETEFAEAQSVSFFEARLSYPNP